jgi:hypothetical protein
MKLTLTAAALLVVLSACSAGASASPVATNKVDLPRSYRFEP